MMTCRYTTLFFDLDDTLYPSGNGLWDAIRDRMNQYMQERLHMPEADVARVRRKYFETYGTTLRGLQENHEVDTDDFLQYVHDLPLEKYLEPTPVLRDILLSLPQQRWIFTNADEAHALRVLARLGLEDCFHGIVDVRAIRFACKPHPEAYRQAMHIAGERDPKRCVMFDDSLRNLAPARTIGFTTVLVGPHPSVAGVDYRLESLLQLERLAELWEMD
jgi:pyrimidine 5'-nucleotidase